MLPAHSRRCGDNMAISLRAPKQGSVGIRLLDAQPHSLTEYLRKAHEFCTCVRFRADETIFNEGDPAEHVYKVQAGAVRLCRTRSDGRRKIVRFVLEGEFFGDVDRAHQGKSAQAIDGATVVSCPCSWLPRVADASPGLDEISALDGSLSAKLGWTAHERVAAFLVEMAVQMDCVDGDTLQLPMPLDDIANYLDLSPMAVWSETLQFKADGLIVALRPNRLLLRDLRALRAVAWGN